MALLTVSPERAFGYRITLMVDVDEIGPSRPNAAPNSGANPLCFDTSLFECHPMWPRRTSGKRRIEIYVEPLVQLQVVALYARHVDFVITFRVDLAEAILVEEVIGDYQPPL